MISPTETLPAASPTELRAQAVENFRQSRYGLFLHYGLYSLLGRHEWVQYREKIPVKEYEKLSSQFTAKGFDAKQIVSFAVNAGFRYINLTTRHHESFCLWNSSHNPFNSWNSPAKRDLVNELYQECLKAQMPLFLYYSHGRDWRHPHAPNNDCWGGNARPEYDTLEPTYAYKPHHNLQIYVQYMEDELTELLTLFPQAAGIWLDGIMVPLSGDYSQFECQRLYDKIRRINPSVLISYKQGLLGTEDFFSPEHTVPQSSEHPHKRGRIRPGAPLEVCTTMCPGSWGFSWEGRGKHRSDKDVWSELCSAARSGYNLLLNTGPLPDGSLDPEDRETLLRVGEKLHKEGFPIVRNAA